MTNPIEILRRAAKRNRGRVQPPKRGDDLMAILSPGRSVTDPDEAEALGLTADARRMRHEEQRP